MKTHRLAGLPALCGFTVLGLLYAAWSWCDNLTELGGDSAAYMLMAHALSPFQGTDAEAARALAGATYPPGFPLLIGLLGGGFVAAHLLVALALVLSLWLLNVWLRDEGLGAAGRAAAVLLFAVMPGTCLLTLNIWSENPYLACSMLAIVAASRAQASDASGHDWWSATLLCGGTVTIRTAGLSLPAALSVLLVMRRPRRWLWMLVAAWLPLLLWLAWSHLHAAGANLYAGQLLERYRHDVFGQLYEQIMIERYALTGAWLAALLGAEAPLQLMLVVAAFGGLCLLGWLLRLRRLRFEAIYLLLYLLMLLVWPWPGEAARLSYVLIPVLIGQGLLLASQLAGFAGPRLVGPLRLALPALLGVTLLPGLAATVQRRLQPVPPQLELVRHIDAYYGDDPRLGMSAAWMQAQLIADMPRLADEVPAADCIFQIKPSVVELLSGRRSITPPPLATADPDFARQIKQCRYAYVMNLASPSFPVAYYPRDRLDTHYHVVRQLPNLLSPNGEILAELIELRPPQP